MAITQPLPVSERNWAMVAHLSSLAGLLGMPFGHVLGPLVVYLSKPEDSEFVEGHARSSLNFQLTIFIFALPLVLGAIVAWIVAIFASPGWHEARHHGYGSIVVPWFATGFVAIALLVAAILIGSLILVVMGTVAAADGRPYRYPFAIPFFRDRPRS